MYKRKVLGVEPKSKVVQEAQLKDLEMSEQSKGKARSKTTDLTAIDADVTAD